MNIPSLLKNQSFPEEIQSAYRDSGLTEFFPPQAEAIDKGVLEGKSCLMCVPTAAGKTLVAELCMLRSILQVSGRCLYIVPLKALASEKYESFKKKFSPAGIKVGLATGDTDTSGSYLSGYHILVATAEKIDSLLRSKADWLVNRLKVMVLDEIHFINDGERGPVLEILAARIKQQIPDIQILALSATVSNSREMADWLKAELVESRWRPIPLREGVYHNDMITFEGSPAKRIGEDEPEDLARVALDTVKGKGQVLVFVNSRRSTQAASRQIAKGLGPLLHSIDKGRLEELAKKAVGSETSSTKICRQLGEVLARGCAFHHAGLKPEQRRLIEEYFRKNVIKVICSTPTLAAGVNLPARRAVIRDVKRFETRRGSSFIPTSEYKQCAGRAGRPGFDEYGEAVLMARTAAEKKVLFERYIRAEPEPVASKLGRPGALRIHILASVAGGYVHDINDTFDFISHTFLAHQRKTGNLLELISQTFDYLQEESFIEKKGFRFYATPFGQCTSQLYIDPESATTIRDGLQIITEGKSFSHIGLTHMFCCCPDAPLLKSLRPSALEGIEGFAASCQDELILTPENRPVLEDYLFYYSTIQTTMMLERWMDEAREEVLCDAFNIGPGDIYRHVESLRWLVYAGIVVADLFRQKKLTFVLGQLKIRIRYGIKEDLIPLVKLKGIGRVRARHLFENGIRHPHDLKSIPVDDLAQIPKIGKSLAEKLVSDIGNC